MAHGIEVLSDKIDVNCVNKSPKNSTMIQHKKTAVTGSRRIFSAPFKIQVLDSYRNDKDCIGNQRATARKYGIHRRQIQKWLQCEKDLRNSCANSAVGSSGPGLGPGLGSVSVTGPALGPGLGLGPVNCGNGGSVNGNGTPAAGTVGIMNGPALNLSVRLHGDVPPTSPSYSPLIINYDKHEDHNLNHKYYGYDNYRHDPIYGVSYYGKNIEKSGPVSPDSTRMDIGFDTKVSGSINGSESNFNLIGSKSDSNKIESDLNFNVIGGKSNYNVIKMNSITNGIPLESNTTSESNYNGNIVNSNISEIRSESNYNGIELTSNKLDDSNGSKCNYVIGSELNDVKSESDLNESIPKSIGSGSDRNESEPNLNGTEFELNNSKIGSIEDSTSESRSSLASSGSDSEDPLDYSLEIPTRDIGRRRSFPLKFKLEVLDGFHQDPLVAGNQRATARKYGINRRQVQKWLGQESELREEIKLRRGELRQRLGASEVTNSPVDLRTGEIEYEYPDRYGFACCYYTECPSVCCRQDEQESPLCLVKPKGSNLPKPKKDYISFKPYLDNPVVKPDDDQNDNDKHNGIYNLYETPIRKTHPDFSVELSFQTPRWGYSYDIPEVPSAFVHYRANFI